MLLQIEIVGLKAPIYQRVLEADYNLFKERVQLELYEELKKRVKDKNFMRRLYITLRRRFPKAVGKAGITYEMFKANLEILETLGMIHYEINHNGLDSSIKLEINEWYFHTIDIMRKSSRVAGTLATIGMTRGKVISKTERELRKLYKPKSFTITDITPPSPEPGAV